MTAYQLQTRHSVSKKYFRLWHSHRQAVTVCTEHSRCMSLNNPRISSMKTVCQQLL